MNKGDDFIFMITGFFMGICFSVLVYLYTDNISFKIEKAKTECEKSLPRDQQCYIIAVPPSKD